MKPAALALLVVLAAAPAARWLQKPAACCPLAGKGMACCPPSGASGGCEWKSGCPEAPQAAPAASSYRAALPPSAPRLFLASASADSPTHPESGDVWLAAPPVPPPRG